MKYEFCVIGGGIIGLSTALALLDAHSGASLVIVEKEDRLAGHQTGHNSGVIHAGIYYAPGSLKAKLCRKGMQATKDFCDANDIRYETCGKLVVATNEKQLLRMEALFDRGKSNGADIVRCGREDIREREPNVVGVGGLFANETSIVDYAEICRAMARKLKFASSEVRLSSEVTQITETGNSVEIVVGGETIHAERLVICGGLQSDRLTRLAGLKADFRIVPFRGEYFQLPPSKNQIVNHLIYPVPEPDMPFLGIHLTRMIDGSVTVGPNAVIGLAREGYRRFSFEGRDALEIMSYPGFWKMIAENWGHALGELRNSLSKSTYLEECRKYCPSLRLEDLRPRTAGIRAQAVTSKGEVLHDFLFAESIRILAVCNAPSPGATSAIPIGEMIAKKLVAK